MNKENGNAHWGEEKKERFNLKINQSLNQSSRQMCSSRRFGGSAIGEFAPT
jgi:hypothetical protein